MNKLQQKSWVGTHIERVKEEILKGFDIPDGWGPQELSLYVAQRFQKTKLEDLTPTRQEEYTEFINSKKGPDGTI